MKKIYILFIVLILFTSFSISVSAHSKELNVIYDDCVPLNYENYDNIGDGYNEKWYELIDRENKSIHIKNTAYDITTIRYYFQEKSMNGNISWSSFLSDDEIIKLKNGIVRSMEKWDNVYYYLDEGGYYSKQKIVNVVEGTENNYNLVIIPTNEGSLSRTKSDTKYLNLNETIETINGIKHIHCPRWQMEINIKEYSKNANSKEVKENILSRVGAHELGHVLGLKDIDMTENKDTINYHHEEVLMGYSSYNDKDENVNYLNRQTEITYRDIAGTAITRGYHTNNNHKWLCDELQNNGKYKLICSICNGVKYVETLRDCNYDLYKLCNDKHKLEDGNMMPIACYGIKDYYKCKYCRYVAPLTDIVEQNYIADIIYDFNYHYIVNDINGLEYRILEKHEYDYDINEAKCKYCNYTVSMDKIVVTDPDSFTNCGSQINVYESDIPLYERSYRGTTIIQGFTRLLYFSTSIAPSLSRLDYDWYTNNDEVAKVTNYGTVIAMKVDSPQWVTITAVYKYNSNIKLYKKLQIIPDTSNEIKYINYKVDMNVTEKYLFQLDNLAPSTTLSYYRLEVLNEDDQNMGVEITKWGTITAVTSGKAYINGVYLLNPNIRIKIEVTVNT